MQVSSPLKNAQFGCRVCPDMGSADFIRWCETHSEEFLDLFHSSGGLFVINGLNEIITHPQLLVRLSRIFGREVENYHETLTNENFFHDQVPEILVLSNNPKVNYGPPHKPSPELTVTGGFLIQYPHRQGWHTDQSYRRPPPDVSLLFGVSCPPLGQGQTLYADATSAYTALDDETKCRIKDLEGYHALTRTGRSLEAVRRGDIPKKLLPHQQSQRHPLVRIHPVTGARSLYLCADEQMDWVIGPIVGLAPGADGEGGEIVRSLMAHLTHPQFVYVHEWDEGDLVVADNRSLIHTATWFDSNRYIRELWRTTVMGNAGMEYARDGKSWIPSEGLATMTGLEELFSSGADK